MVKESEKLKGLKNVLSAFSDVMCLSVLWCVFSIPIVTMGAASCGLYYAVQKSVRGHRGYAYQEFLRGFKVNFKQATEGWLLMLFVCAFLGCDIYIVSKWERAAGSIFLLAVFVIVLLAAFGCGLYYFSFICRFEGTVKQGIKNAGLIALGEFSRTILLMFVLAAAVVLCVIFPPAVLVVPGIYMLIKNRIQEKIFRKFMSEEDLALEMERNGECM